MAWRLWRRFPFGIFLVAFNLSFAAWSLVRGDYWLTAISLTGASFPIIGIVMLTTGLWSGDTSDDLGVEHKSFVEAEQKADTLLRKFIGDNAYNKAQRSGYLEVDSPNHPDRVYWVPIDRGVTRIYDKGALSMYLCVVPIKWLPTGDRVLMHKLWIEADEGHYLNTAHKWYVDGTRAMPLTENRRGN